MSDRAWLQHYPPGIPAEIDISGYSSIPDLLDRIAEKFGDRPAFHNLGRSISFSSVDRMSRRFAAFLQGLHGTARGDRVAVMLPNLLQYPVALFGILRAGMTVVNVNPLYTARELEQQLKDSGAKAIVVLENFAGTLQKALRNTEVRHVVTTQIGDLLSAPKRWAVNFAVKHVKKMVPPWRIEGAIPFLEAMGRGEKGRLEPVPLEQDDVAFLQYTGGTTGISKGAMLTHGNILSNIEQMGLWVSPRLEEGNDIAIAPLPMYHVFCLTATLALMKWGSLSVLITNPRDLSGFIKELKRWKFTVLTGVNTLFKGLLNTAGFDKLDFSRLKIVVGGGASVQKPVAEQWQKVTGAHLLEAYGLTETSPGVCGLPVDRPWNGTIGYPIPSTEVSIRNDDFEELPRSTGPGDVGGCIGEICVRGPQVMKGYWNNPGETEKGFRDGWLKTGDVGYMDVDGCVTIVERKKDMILVSGFNVYPNEIESVVAEHPGVAEVAAIGSPDEKSGEAVNLFVVRKDPALTEEELHGFCRERLAGYKRPRRIVFRDALPKSPVGKIIRRELRNR
jgi:long-chain acyl-CoA synthetase